MIGGAGHLDGFAEWDAALEEVAKVAAKRRQICGIGRISLGMEVYSMFWVRMARWPRLRHCSPQKAN
jgi:hypothetical protein